MAIPRFLSDVKTWLFGGLICGFVLGDIAGDISSTLIIVFLMAMMVFSLDGLKIEPKDVSLYRKKIFICILCSTVICAALSIVTGLFYPDEYYKGWIMLACVPSAIAIISGTFLVKGDMKLVTIGTFAIYVLALATAPLLSFMLIGDAINPLEILKYVVLFIVVPYIISRVIGLFDLPKNFSSMSLNICYFLFLSLSFGRVRDVLWEHPEATLLIAIGCLFRVVLVPIVSEITMKMARVEREERIPYIFLLFWKNSGLALAMTIVLVKDQPLAILPPAISLLIETFSFLGMIWYFQKMEPPAVAE